jgi:hypothetical protein
VSGNRAGDPSRGGKVAKVAKVAPTHPSGIYTSVQYTHPNTECPCRAETRTDYNPGAYPEGRT